MSTTEIQVSLKERSYPIIIQDQGFDAIIPTLERIKSSKNIVIITHPNLEKLYAEEIIKQLSPTYKVHVITVNEGEKSKSLDHVSNILDQLCELKCERRDTILALGGGVIGDLGGFCASIYLRGINLIQLPTTLLSQVDASVGGKTGVNHSTGKNLIGSFYQPKAVIINLSTLNTLPKRELQCGLAEIVKYGIIIDTQLFKTLSDEAETITQLSPKDHLELWKTLIIASVEAKAEVVSKDEQESGLREILNLGHTFAHAIETEFSYDTYHHGEAVAIGIRLATNMASDLKLISSEDAISIIDLLNRLRFDLTIQNTTTGETLTKYLKSDKKVRNGQIRFVLPTQIGKTITQAVDDIPLVEATFNAALKPS